MISHDTPQHFCFLIGRHAGFLQERETRNTAHVRGASILSPERPSMSVWWDSRQVVVHSAR